MKTTINSASSKRRSPIGREEGRQRLINASITLLQKTPFSQVSVREIAKLADVNKTFIHSWFGSQQLLYLSVAERMIGELLNKITTNDSKEVALNPFDQDVKFTVRLLFWLELEGLDTSLLSPLMDRLLEAYTIRLVSHEGLSVTTAKDLTPQAAALGLGIASYGKLLGMENPVNFARSLELWRRQLDFLREMPTD